MPAGPELIVILVIVLLVFGVGRISRVGGELGSAIREFRAGLAGDEDPKSLGQGSSETVANNQQDKQHAE